MLSCFHFYLGILLVFSLDGVQSEKCNSPECTVIYKCNSNKGLPGPGGAMGVVGAPGEPATQEICGDNSKGDKGEPKDMCTIPGERGFDGYDGVPGPQGQMGLACVLDTEFFLTLCSNLSVESGPINMEYCVESDRFASFVMLPISGEKGEKGEPGALPPGGGLDQIPTIDAQYPSGIRPPRVGAKGEPGRPGSPGLPGFPGIKGEPGKCECTSWNKLGLIGTFPALDGVIDGFRAVTYFDDIDLMKNASWDTHPRGTLAYYSKKEALFIRSSEKWKEIKTIPKYGLSDKST